MLTPLNDVLKLKSEHVSFHTPGHSGGIVISALSNAPIDVTELSFSDNLLKAEGVILQSEREVSRAYGTENVLYSTAGATALIHTVIRGLRNRGNFLIYGEAHKSIYNALRLYVGSGYAYSGNDLRKAIKDSVAGVVIVTSPNYFGLVKDVKEIRNICDEAGAVLVVDASHGAHFAFSQNLPKSATECADLVIHSCHKTMPVLTGGAILNYTDEYKDVLLTAFREIHTTSPSYPVMASIEGAVNLLNKEGEVLYIKALSKIAEFKSGAKGKAYEVLPTDDKTRLVVETHSDALKIAEALEACNVYPEMVYGSKLVFIVTPFNADKLNEVQKVLDAQIYAGDYKEVSFSEEALTQLNFVGEMEKIPFEKAEGRVAYDGVGLYPPGVPVILPGEKISKQKVDFLIGRLKLTFGLENGMVNVIK
ncbi:MAG: aminotransferase class I/II-fold pyridoxal phosphate-dependent enzyme [Clostridia bacterium]|nr:aminotransferase class I/II-fold pyridoxal phosphate-dependent enzyme [Clostridia bacterium]